MIYIAIIVGAIASMAVGFLWYGPLFGKLWMEISGRNPETINAVKAGGMGKIYALNALFELVTAYVIWILLSMLAITTVVGAWELVLWAWIGFAVPIHLGAVLWEGKSWKLFALHALRQLVSYLVIALALILIAH